MLKRVLLTIATLLCASSSFADTVSTPLPTSATWTLIRGSTGAVGWNFSSAASCYAAAPSNAAALKSGSTYVCRQDLKFSVTYTAPKNPFPNGELQTVQCISPATGSWTQTRIYTLVSGTYMPSAWVPATAPAGACPTPVTTTDTAWVTIAAQGQDWVVFPENGQVRYGWGIAWDTKTVTTGVFGCNDWFLNEPKTGGATHDPMPGFAKVCQKLVTAPHVTQPAMGIPAVNPAFVQAAAIGVPGPRLGGSVGTGDSGNPNQDTGAMREPCAFSHFLNDDPIVFPALPGKSHLHLFFGNVAINAQTTAGTIAAAGNSTCAGGDLNRTGYWVPAVIDVRTGRPLVPQTELVLAYYKGGYLGAQSGGKIQPFPAGLRMIAGSASNTTEVAQAGVIRIWCEHGDGTIRGRIPSCNKGEQLAFEVIFPQCWDGVNLDSPNHKDHMAYATGQGCPADHPIALPELSMNIKYVVEESGTDTYLRLASDNYTGPGGYSMHADWFNGWDPATLKTWVTHCIDPMKDCHAALMGNGQYLY